MVTANPGHTVQDFLSSDDCCNLPELDIQYGYVASNPIEQVRQAKVDPVFLTAPALRERRQPTGAASRRASTALAPDLFNSPNQDFIQQVLSDATNLTVKNLQGQLNRHRPAQARSPTCSPPWPMAWTAPPARS